MCAFSTRPSVHGGAPAAADGGRRAPTTVVSSPPRLAGLYVVVYTTTERLSHVIRDNTKFCGNMVKKCSYLSESLGSLYLFSCFYLRSFYIFVLSCLYDIFKKSKTKF